jgi:hypothetical protein
MSRPEYEAWWKPGNTPSQNALLTAAWVIDKENPREIGRNRGFWVEKFLAACGLGAGYAWCAAYVTWCLRVSGYKSLPKGSAAVRNWATWAKDTGRLVDTPRRGDLFFWLDKNQMTGHIGWVVSVLTGKIETLEGNTSPGVEGNQREGDGAYRRTRPITENMRFIRL